MKLLSVHNLDILCKTFNETAFNRKFSQTYFIRCCLDVYSYSYSPAADMIVVAPHHRPSHCSRNDEGGNESIAVERFHYVGWLVGDA